MEINRITKKLGKFNIDSFLRIDSKFHIAFNESGWDVFNVESESLVPLSDYLYPFYLNCKYLPNKEYNGVPTGREYIDKFGEITSFQIVNRDNHPGRLKYSIDNECILISSLKGAITPALNFQFDLSDYVFSNGFYIFKTTEKANKTFLLYLLRTKLIKKLLDNALYRGIGISSYREDDLLKIRIPSIDIEFQNTIVKSIKPLESQIKQLKDSRLDEKGIINKVFADEFKINLSELIKLERQRQVNITLEDIAPKNSNFRNSYRWYKMQKIQEYLYKDIDCIERLGRYLHSTKNGWSPTSIEGVDGTPILGQEHFSHIGKLSLTPSKATEITRNNIEDFYVKQGDFFVSRGNTIDLVALASIVKGEVGENILYPDLYIKLDIDETVINKEYLALLINSFIGRLYFKYVAKGKNQTMVKISSTELNEFQLPIPTLTIQQKIVKKIQQKLKVQSNIDTQIEQKQEEINSLIENTIKQEV